MMPEHTRSLADSGFGLSKPRSQCWLSRQTCYNKNNMCGTRDCRGLRIQDSGNYRWSSGELYILSEKCGAFRRDNSAFSTCVKNECPSYGKSQIAKMCSVPTLSTNQYRNRIVCESEMSLSNVY
ncbi:hypothetical protein evm_005789 [Chilo suppressalis]|nr:hypothetical protein evm_005789 [Chilo suppressalis]